MASTEHDAWTLSKQSQDCRSQAARMEHNAKSIRGKACHARPCVGRTQACKMAMVQEVYELNYLPVLFL